MFLYILGIFIIALGVVAAILKIILKHKWKGQTPLGKALFVVLIVAAILGGLKLCLKQHEDQKKQDRIDEINKSYGDLLDTSTAKIPLINVGGSKYRPSKPGGPMWVDSMGRPYFKAWTVHDSLKFTTVVHDLNGNPIAAVYASEWTVYDKKYEYNNSAKALEIVTKGDHDVIMQAEFKNGEVRLAGRFIDEFGSGIALWPVADNDSSGSIFQIYRNHKLYTAEEVNYQPKLLFKYPRERYVGVRAD